MSELKVLLIEELQDLLNAENQIVAALPKMIEAAHAPKLKESFEKHLVQTREHVERLKQSFELLGESAQSQPCKGMKGLLEEGEEIIRDGEDRDELIADLAMIGAAQKVEHYEISGYGTARCLARQLGEREVATLLSRTLGEEESTDFLLTELTKPLIQQITSVEVGNGTKTPWGEPGEVSSDPSRLNSNVRVGSESRPSQLKTKKAKA
jgi:Mn-containing catalase